MWRVRILAAALLSALFPAAVQADVVISELLWSGSDLTSADEWIEFANTGTGDIALDGWMVTKLSEGEEVEMFTFPPSTVVGSGGYFLVGNKDETESRLAIVPDLVTTAVSLANTQLLLRLYNALGERVDSVDDGIGAPFAGSNDFPKASMERIALTGSGQLKENWQTATTFLNIDDGAPLFGTPRAANGTGPSEDTTPPKEATFLSAEVLHSTLMVSWTPSVSLDLHEQELSVFPAIGGNTQWSLPKTATGALFTEEIGTGTGFAFTLRSKDAHGNTSSGITVISTLFPEIKITEVLANPAGVDDEEWIEIGNLGKEAVDIAGWILDEGNSPDAYRIAPRENTAFLLLPGEHVAFFKSLTTLPLDNRGETLTLKRGSTIMDQWAYIETAEEVSYGREMSTADAFRAFCVPTKNKPNAHTLSDPRITVQSGDPIGTHTVTLNLLAEVQTGSTLHASCTFDFDDGYLSESCNPPSHTITTIGIYTIHLTYTDFCGEVAERTLTATVGSAPPSPPPEPDPPPSGDGGGSRGHGGSGGGGRTSCEPDIFDGIRVSEAFPNPEGDDAELEWIELENTHARDVSLCGWQVDDGPEGSRPHPLDSYTMSPGGFLPLSRNNTHIALNNTNERIRLIAPDASVREVTYAESIEGESYALRNDGVYVFTPFPTPGDTNRFREAGSSMQANVIIAAALPNPDGRDEGEEWIEIQNVSDHRINLQDWVLDNKEGGSPAFPLDGITLQPDEVRRLTSEETKITLTNTEDSARLIDPAGTVVSVLAWQDAASGQVYRPITFANGMEAEVIAIIDGDTIDVSVAGKKERIRLLGIDAPETVHPWKPLEKFGEEARETLRTLLKGNMVTLHFESTTRDRYGRMLAYVLLPDGTNVNGELVRRGLARAYLRYPFGLSQLFARYEEEARRNRWGFWADEKTAEFIAQSDGIPESTTPGEGTGTLLLANLMLNETGALMPKEGWQGELHRILISEVMSNPPKDGPLAEIGEYLELWNPGAEDGNVSGWILDDAPNASSKPHILSEGTTVPAQGFLVLHGKELSISLNNEGEDLSLTAPDGTVVATAAYPKLKRGEAYALRKISAAATHESLLRQQWCVTHVPTPGKDTICRSLLVALSEKKEKKVKTAQKEKNKEAGKVSSARPRDPVSMLDTVYRIESAPPVNEERRVRQMSPPLLTQTGTSHGSERSTIPPLLHHALIIFTMLISLLGTALARFRMVYHSKT